MIECAYCGKWTDAHSEKCSNCWGSIVVSQRHSEKRVEREEEEARLRTALEREKFLKEQEENKPLNRLASKVATGTPILASKVSAGTRKSLELTRKSLKALQNQKEAQGMSSYSQSASTEELDDFVRGLLSQEIVTSVNLKRLTPTLWKVFWTESG